MHCCICRRTKKEYPLMEFVPYQSEFGKWVAKELQCRWHPAGIITVDLINNTLTSEKTDEQEKADLVGIDICFDCKAIIDEEVIKTLNTTSGVIMASIILTKPYDKLTTYGDSN